MLLFVEAANNSSPKSVLVNIPWFYVCVFRQRENYVPDNKMALNVLYIEVIIFKVLIAINQSSEK